MRKKECSHEIVLVHRRDISKEQWLNLLRTPHWQTNPTKDYHIPTNQPNPVVQLTFQFIITSDLMDKRLFKSYIRYSGEGKDGRYCRID